MNQCDWDIDNFNEKPQYFPKPNQIEPNQTLTTEVADQITLAFLEASMSETCLSQDRASSGSDSGLHTVGVTRVHEFTLQAADRTTQIVNKWTNFLSAEKQHVDR